MFIVGTAMEATSLKHAGEALCDVVEVRWDKFRVPDEELVKREKDNIKWDVMGMLRVMYQDDALKITEKESLSRYHLYTIEGRYGDIVIELYVEEVMVL